MYVESITLLTKEYNEYTVITPKVLDIVKRSGVQNGIVTVLTKHTTTGVTVNEALECLESDIENFLGRLIPEDYPYSHARMLRDYGKRPEQLFQDRSGSYFYADERGSYAERAVKAGVQCTDRGGKLFYRSWLRE